MSPDVKLKDYYLKFINEAKDNIRENTKLKKDCISIKLDVYNYINEHKEEILDEYHINLDKYDIEWKQQRYNPVCSLYNKVNLILRTKTDFINKSNILQLYKYCAILRNEYNYDKSIELAANRKKLTLVQYKYFVYRYYTEIHKCVLNGFGYKFEGGIGTYMINHWKLDYKNGENKKYIDFNETNRRKRELIAKGIKLYDPKEAAWYEARHIPYNAVDYRVYKTSKDYYDFTFMHSDITRKSTLDYKRTEYISAKYRGMGYKELADKFCDTDEDVYNLQVDIKYKLNILLYKDPTKYLRYVRTADQIKYKYR